MSKRKYDNTNESSSDTIILDDDEDPKPECQYGSKCYRENPEHFKKFSHPETQTKKSKLISTKKNLIFLTKIHNVANSIEINSSYSLSLKDILSEDKHEFLESAQFNYMHDLEWLLEQYPIENRNKPLTIIHGNSKRSELDELAESYPQIKLIRAKLESAYGTHHTKMMFLLYKTGLRIVIHTSNLIEADWGQKTQGIWKSELFPKINSDLKKNPITFDSKTKFKSYLLTYLEHYKEDKLNHWMEIIKSHDMKNANVFLVGSVPGRFQSEKKIFGHIRLRKILSDYLKKSCPNEEPDRLICQFSSIGSLGPSEDKWLCKEFTQSLTSSQNVLAPKITKPVLIYPSVEDVFKSFEGPIAGGSLPYSKSVSLKQPYLNEFFYRWKAHKTGRTRASPHIKTFARYSSDYKKLYWFLLTSANLSKAAWGSFEKNESQYHILSYEMGVLFIPEYVNNDGNECFNLDETEPEFLVPYDLPPIKYNEKDKPWLVDYLLNL